MKRITLILAALLLCGVSLRGEHGNECPNICGVWLGQEKTSKVEICKEGTLWQGKAVWNSEYGDVSGQNIMVLRNLAYDADDNDWNGKIYDPFHNKIYNVTVSLQPDGRLKVVARAGIISKTMVWTRVES